jgi:hypothetical protein
VAAATNDVSIVFNLSGSLGGALLMFVLPAAVYIKAVPRPTRGSIVRRWWAHVLAMVCFVWGLAVAALVSGRSQEWGSRLCSHSISSQGVVNFITSVTSTGGTAAPLPPSATTLGTAAPPLATRVVAWK